MKNIGQPFQIIHVYLTFKNVGIAFLAIHGGDSRFLAFISEFCHQRREEIYRFPVLVLERKCVRYLDELRFMLIQKAADILNRHVRIEREPDQFSQYLCIVEEVLTDTQPLRLRHG